jgi:hypothetical protein
MLLRMRGRQDVCLELVPPLGRFDVGYEAGVAARKAMEVVERAATALPGSRQRRVAACGRQQVSTQIALCNPLPQLVLDPGNAPQAQD